MRLRAALASIILGLLTTVLGELLGISQRINPVDTGVLNSLWARVVGVTVLVALIIYGVLDYLIRRRENLREENAPRAFSSKSEPRTVLAEGEIEKFGVKWTGKYGTFRRRSYTDSDDAYVYVEGPFCPEDGRNLKSRTVPKWFVFEEEAWVCPHCERTYPRSTTHYLGEDNVVEDELEQRFEQQSSKGRRGRR